MDAAVSVGDSSGIIIANEYSVQLGSANGESSLFFRLYTRFDTMTITTFLFYSNYNIHFLIFIFVNTTFIRLFLLISLVNLDKKYLIFLTLELN